MKCFDTWSGVVTSAAGSLVTNSLNEAVVGARYESALGEDGKKITRLTHSKLDGFNSSQIESIQKLNGTIGGLASAGLSYGLTGEATFNILNITDFGAKAGSGLLEMTLSKDRGVTARLGTGGTDLSLGTVSSSLQGIKNLNKNMQIARAASRNNMGNAATALRTQYGFGDEKQLVQLEEILKGRTELKRGNGDGKAQTVTENGKRTVYLNSYKENMTREEQLALGITLGHEAYRDGITGGAQGQFNETAEAVLGHTALAKRMQSDSMYNYMMTGLINTDINLKNDMTAFDYALATGDWDAFGNYVVGNNYDYSADYWRITVDKDKYVRNVQEDGDSSIITCVDEEGNILDIDIAKGSLKEQIASKYGYKQSKSEISDLMFNEFGLNFSGKAWYAVDKNNIYKGGATKYGMLWDKLLNRFEKYINEDTELFQQDIETALNQDKNTACAVTASALLNNDFLETFLISKGLSNKNIIEALADSKGEMFTEKTSWVNSFNGLNAKISAKFNSENYLVFSKFYNSLSEAQENGVEYALLKYTNKNNPNRTHFVRYFNGIIKDPYKKRANESVWWSSPDNYSTKVYEFKPKF